MSHPVLTKYAQQHPNIYQVKCESCGGFVSMHHDRFRSETTADGKKRYWHIPTCPTIPTSLRRQS